MDVQDVSAKIRSVGQFGSLRSFGPFCLGRAFQQTRSPCRVLLLSRVMLLLPPPFCLPFPVRCS